MATSAVVYSASLRSFAHAIATAEGFFVAGSVPQRANNPGDLKMPGWTGPTLGAEHVTVFPTAADGWAALYHQLNLIRCGKSHVYTADMTIAEMALHYTDTQRPEWARNVAHALGVTPDAKLNIWLS